jgi:putative two-component system response regulator
MAGGNGNPAAYGALRGDLLVIEDDPTVGGLLVKQLEREGHRVERASTGEQALGFMECWLPDVILSDLQLPGIDGFEVCRRIKRNASTRLIPVVLITGLDARQHRLEGIIAGADDFLSKPYDVQELKARVQSLLRLKRYTDDLESAESVILSLAMTVEARDRYTQGHCERLAHYACLLGAAVGCRDDQLRALRLGGYLHDVGKIAVPDAVLQKPGSLTEDEYDVIKQHPIVGERLCGSLRSLAPVRPIVRHHHERLDGQGYPDRLRGDDVPLLAQIVGVVDVYDALTTPRPYRGPLPDSEAFAELRREAAQGLRQPALVEAFIEARSSELRTVA